MDPWRGVFYIGAVTFRHASALISPHGRRCVYKSALNSSKRSFFFSSSSLPYFSVGSKVEKK
jgi:hypothetical protein